MSNAAAVVAFAASGVGSRSSSASIGPRPRTSPTIGWRAAISSSRVRGRSELLEHGERGRAGDGIAAERAAQPAHVDRVHQLGATRHAREREPAAERLPRDEQVRFYAELLDRPDRAGAAAAGLHFVVDVHDPVLVADPAQRLHELRRHRDEAALALHRLEHDARHVRRVDVLLEEELEAGERVLRRDAAERVRRRGTVYVRSERAEALLVDELRRHRHRQARASVERPVEDDDSGPPGRGTRDLDRVLDRLGAGVHEDRSLLRPRARRELGEQAARLDVRLVARDHEALMEVAVDLLVDRGDDSLGTVAGVLAGDPAGEVEVGPPVGVDEACALRALDHEPRRRHASSHVPPPRLDQPLGRARLPDRH